MGTLVKVAKTTDLAPGQVGTVLLRRGLGPGSRGPHAGGLVLAGRRLSQICLEQLRVRLQVGARALGTGRIRAHAQALDAAGKNEKIEMGGVWSAPGEDGEPGEHLEGGKFLIASGGKNLKPAKAAPGIVEYRAGDRQHGLPADEPAGSTHGSIMAGQGRSSKTRFIGA